MQKAFEKRSLLSCSWSIQGQPWSPVKARSEDVVTVMTGQCSGRTFFFFSSVHAVVMPWTTGLGIQRTPGSSWDYFLVRWLWRVRCELRAKDLSRISIQMVYVPEAIGLGLAYLDEIWGLCGTSWGGVWGVLGGCVNFWRELMAQRLHVVTTILWLRLV